LVSYHFRDEAAHSQDVDNTKSIPTSSKQSEADPSHDVPGGVTMIANPLTVTFNNPVYKANVLPGVVEDLNKEDLAVISMPTMEDV